MNVLTLNCGSSSIKFKLFSMPEENLLLTGNVEKVGRIDCALYLTLPGGDQNRISLPFLDYAGAIKRIISVLKPYRLDYTGHRVVHGGSQLRVSTRITPDVISILKEYCKLAPLHNPANITGIEVISEALPFAPQVAVFDNNFHLTLPPKAYMYGLPYEYYEQHGIRRYGFHGISYSYMVKKAEVILQRSLLELRIVSLMLGSGTSANACFYGQSVDVSTGFTPTEGLLQSTRCGDLDPSLLIYLMKYHGFDPDNLESLINRESGWLGLSGVDGDFREVEKAAMEGNSRALLALEVLAYQAKKYIGSYAAAMGGLDVIIFSGGIGENSARLRKDICGGLEFLGIELDPELNSEATPNCYISSKGSPVSVLLIHTDEEIVIARETVKVLEG